MITSKAEVVVARRKIEKIGKICVVTKRNDEGRLMNKRKKIANNVKYLIVVESHSSTLVANHYDFLQYCIVSETRHFDNDNA